MSGSAGATQQTLVVNIIKQYPGVQQVARSVKVRVPGKHFPGLTPTEQSAFYEGTAVEFAERHKFERHIKAWGNAHTGPGIRFICMADAIDDPDHKGFWSTLALWNRWRHETYKENRDAELQFLDKLPAAAVAPANAPAGPKPKEEPEIKKHYRIVSMGRLKGATAKCYYYACLSPRKCSRRSCKKRA